MRIKIALKKNSNNVKINVNYNYSIFKQFKKALDYFQDNLVNLNCPKDYENIPYTFSNLIVPERKIYLNTMEIHSKVNYLYFSSIDECIVRKIMAYFSLFPDFEIDEVKFSIIGIQVMPDVQFKNHREYKFLAISPFVINLPNEYGEYEKVDIGNYKKLSAFFKESLCSRYKAFNKNAEVNNFYFSFTFDEEYLLKRKNQISKLISVIDQNECLEKISSVMSPFRVIGSPELIYFGYNAGFGYKTFIGFGMGELVKEDSL